MLPVSRPSLGIQEIENIKKVFDTCWLGHGSSVIEFETRVSELLGAPYVVAVNSGTSALHIALDALGVGYGDEVVVPSFTFCSCAQVITALDATPVFCDVDPDTLNIDVDDAMRCITNKTKAIMPVHLCGNACDMDHLLEIGRTYGLRVVEDAAHAFGTSYKERMIGGFGDVTCFSFDPIKNITCGEGGAVATTDERVADIIRRKRMLGIDRDGWQRSHSGRNYEYEVNTQGYRYHMSNINAAIGLAQLPKLHIFRDRKRDIVRQYNECFGRIGGLRVIKWDLEESCPFAYILLVGNGLRDSLRAFLSERGVGTGLHYIPNHIQPHFAAYSRRLPVTERLYDEIITLPLYSDMSDDDVSLVQRSVMDFFETNYDLARAG
jgi:dTDP-4-amino-4,6-dideoxygalactose transaminase